MHARKLATIAACTCLALTGCHSPSQTEALSDDHFHPDDSTTAEAIPSEIATSEATDITDEQWQAMASAIPSDFDSPSPTVPAEYENALEMAQGYSDKLHMSKARLYDQLTSQHGERFDPAAAKYAIKHVDADWKANALAMAEDYRSIEHMSKSRIREQLTSEHGEKFTQSEADYAVKHLS